MLEKLGWEYVTVVKARISVFVEKQRDYAENQCHKICVTDDKMVKQYFALKKKKTDELTEDEKDARKKVKLYFKRMHKSGFGRNGMKSFSPLPMKSNHVNFIAVTETTASTMGLIQFKEGDTVRHRVNSKEGTVVKNLEKGKVLVKFDEESKNKKGKNNKGNKGKKNKGKKSKGKKSKGKKDKGKKDKGKKDKGKNEQTFSATQLILIRRSESVSEEESKVGLKLPSPM